MAEFTQEHATSLAVEAAALLPAGTSIIARTFDYGRAMGFGLTAPDGRRHAVKRFGETSAEDLAREFRAWMGGGSGTGREAAAGGAGDQPAAVRGGG